MLETYRIESFDGGRMEWTPVAALADKGRAIRRMKELFYSAEGAGKSYRVVSDGATGRMTWAMNLRANQNEKEVENKKGGI